MADTRGIDRVFDGVDKIVDSVGRFFDSNKHVEDKRTERTARAEAEPASTELARRRYKVIEVVDAETNALSWIVTDGVARCECTSRAMADKVVRALEAAQ